MTLNLRDLFFVTTLVAAYLGMRQAAIRTEVDQWIGFGILGIGVAVAVYAAQRNWTYFTIFLLAGLSALLLATSWALECVYLSAGTSFLRKHPIQSKYTTDPELNTIVVIVGTILVSFFAGVLGSALKLVLKRKRTI